MTVKERTTLFNVCVGIFNIVLGLLLETILIAGCFFILARIPNPGESIPVNVILPFVLFAGLILAMMISIKCVTWAINKFNLEDKLDPKAVKRYIKKDL